MPHAFCGNLHLRAAASPTYFYWRFRRFAAAAASTLLAATGVVRRIESSTMTPPRATGRATRVHTYDVQIGRRVTARSSSDARCVRVTQSIPPPVT